MAREFLAPGAATSQTHPVDSQALNALARIGADLDRHGHLRVTDGGFVVLSEPDVPSNPSTELCHGKAKTGSKAGACRRAARRQGPPGASWASSAAAPVVGADPEARYERELSGICRQYPGAQYSRQADGIWLITSSALLEGLREHAIFLTGVSFSGRMARSWAFWGDPLAYPSWIGPRHTNFPDGSVCAFEPSDNTWQFGQPIVTLLDLLTVWAIRHLYLREFKRWPGHQSVHFPGERILEMRPDEHCGCANSAQLYAQCCMPRDLTGDRIRYSLDFFRRTGGVREPPRSVVEYIRYGGPLPDLATLVTSFAPLLG